MSNRITVKYKSFSNTQCEHIVLTTVEAWQNLSVQFCRECGSLIVRKEIDAENGLWKETEVDPFTVYLNLGNFSKGTWRRTVSQELQYVRLTNGDVWYYFDGKIRLAQADAEMSHSLEELNDNGYPCDSLWDGILFLITMGDVSPRDSLKVNSGYYPFGVF